jgi:hypothetical protein
MSTGRTRGRFGSETMDINGAQSAVGAVKLKGEVALRRVCSRVEFIGVPTCYLITK